MIADVNKQGMITLKSETRDEADKLRKWVVDNVSDSGDFTACCNNKKCEFHVELKDNGNSET
jgi:hypothetical protein